jgi:hypothetical protein
MSDAGKFDLKFWIVICVQLLAPDEHVQRRRGTSQDRGFVRGQEQEQLEGDDAEHEAKGQDGRPAADGQHR